MSDDPQCSQFSLRLEILISPLCYSHLLESQCTCLLSPTLTQTYYALNFLILIVLLRQNYMELDFISVTRLRYSSSCFISFTGYHSAFNTQTTKRIIYINNYVHFSSWEASTVTNREMKIWKPL